VTISKPLPPPSAEPKTSSLTTGGDLFRSEVLAERQSQWLGTVLLVPRVSHVGMTLFALAAAAAVLALLVFAGYTRKERVHGWLVPGSGLVRIFAPQPGVLVEIYVEEGAEVTRGTPLAVLSTELHSETLGAIRREVVQRLASRRESLIADRQRQEQLYTEQMGNLTRRLETVLGAVAQLESESSLQRSMLTLTEQAVQRQRALFANRITPVDRLQQAETDRLQVLVRLQTLERERSRLTQERVTLEAEHRELPLRSQLQLSELERNIAALEQEVAEAEARRQIVITAPQDGTITSLQAEPGGAASTTVPLLSIVPAGAQLEARLFVPSRAVGFVRTGQRVQLRYLAFPYQKFGQYQGMVAQVSSSAISPSDLPQQLAGLTGLYGAGAPIYRITVALARQTVTAYGNPVPLQPGMQLEADVLVERRRLIEWILDPLFTLTGSWHR
jgi:membrane fusion protein